MINDNETTDYRLDPGTFPQRIEVELTEEIVEKISALAEKTSRSFSEVATDILSKNRIQ